jgi:hypothetical protein
MLDMSADDAGWVIAAILVIMFGALVAMCKRRSESPSLKQPDSPVASE